MSYVQQQEKVQAEIEERARRKIEDELEMQNDDAQQALEAQTHLYTGNGRCCDDLDRHISRCAVSIEYEEHENVNNLKQNEKFLFVFQT